MTEPRLIRSRRVLLLLSVVAVAALVGCDNMADQPKAEPHEASSFFADGSVARHPPSHTVSRAERAGDFAFMTGVDNGRFLREMPLKLSTSDLARGQLLFNAHCAVCHGEDGYGNGIIAQRGFPNPPSYHNPRLRAAANGYLFRVITDGYGAMYPYGGRIEAADRWRIIAYVRALQLSQHATRAQLPEDLWARLQEEVPNE